MKSVYIETSIPSYLTGRPSRDIQTAAWQQVTAKWWEEERAKYQLYISELVIVEAGAGDRDAAERRVRSLEGISELSVCVKARALAERFVKSANIPAKANVDALHIAIACVNEMDYFLTWNCRHINNAVIKPFLRKVCAEEGYMCPEICTPQEFLSEDADYVS